MTIPPDMLPAKPAEAVDVSVQFAPWADIDRAMPEAIEAGLNEPQPAGRANLYMGWVARREAIGSIEFVEGVEYANEVI